MNTHTTPADAAGARKPTVNFLVVCGVTTTDDSWYFGNFVGSCRALQRVGITGEFWSSFPVWEYFQEEKDNIKFGRTDKHDCTPMDIYTEHELKTVQPFWTHYPSDKHADIVPDVMQYLATASMDTVKGDHLTVVLCGHGNEEGTRLGSKILTDDHMVSAFQQLKPGVQVNLVVQAYHSGIFDKLSIINQKLRYAHKAPLTEGVSYPNDQSFKSRLRNSPFSNTSSQGLGILFDPNSSTWTLGVPIAHVARASKDSPNNQTNKTTFQSYTESELYTTFTNTLHNRIHRSQFPHSGRCTQDFNSHSRLPCFTVSSCWASGFHKTLVVWEIFGGSGIDDIISSE